MNVNPFEIITLCYKCKRSFEEAGNKVSRVKQQKPVKVDTCDFCHVKNGYDYKITPKQARK